jgi:hypothetical protein
MGIYYVARSYKRQIQVQCFCRECYPAGGHSKISIFNEILNIIIRDIKHNYPPSIEQVKASLAEVLIQKTGDLLNAVLLQQR